MRVDSWIHTIYENIYTSQPGYKVPPLMRRAGLRPRPRLRLRLTFHIPALRTIPLSVRSYQFPRTSLSPSPPNSLSMLSFLLWPVHHVRNGLWVTWVMLVTLRSLPWSASTALCHSERSSSRLGLVVSFDLLGRIVSIDWRFVDIVLYCPLPLSRTVGFN